MPDLPQDVKDWIRYVFASCNHRTSRKMARIPTVHETSLDLTFIEHFSQFASPVRLPSAWTIRLDTHYLGGGRHFGQWEIADIGLLVLFRRGGQLIRSKIGLLQSKRLYPVEQHFNEDQPLDYFRGIGRLLEEDPTFAKVVEPRRFSFTEASIYRGLQVADNQYRAISDYEKKFSIPVHYLFYNPLTIPFSSIIPIVEPSELPADCEVGSRVVPASVLREGLKGKSTGYCPAFSDLTSLLPVPFGRTSHQAGWRFGDFVTDLLIDCKEGYVATRRDDPGLDLVFNRRTGPISAAMSITFDAPP